MENGLKMTLEQIRAEVLPNTREMRAVIDEQRSQELYDKVEAKLCEYKILFERFKTGQELSSDELRRMTVLSSELEKLSGN